VPEFPCQLRILLCLLQVLLAGAAAFVEKPISCLPLAEVLPYADEVRRVAAQRSLPISVGYMFRCVLENRACRRPPSPHLPCSACDVSTCRRSRLFGFGFHTARARATKFEYPIRLPPTG
jgi:hypothetical protein